MKRSSIFYICSAYCIILNIFLLFYIFKYKNVESINDKSWRKCGRFPTEEHITVNNLVWQILEIPKGFVNILNAYVDLRQNKSAIRINVNSVILNESDTFYCQFWLDELQPPTTVKATEVLRLWIFYGLIKGETYPYLIECPFEGTSPISVSLVAVPCDHAENNLKIIDRRPVGGVKKRFGVCSKRITYVDRDYVWRVIEWIHLMRLLGAEKVHFSYDYVHPDLFTAIQYFEDQGIVESWQYFDPAGMKDTFTKRFLQMNDLNDCFHRVKNLYDFVVIIDMDEVIMPVMPEDLTWEDLMTRTNATHHFDYHASKNVYYPNIEGKSIEKVPKFMYMLQHIQRSQNFSIKYSAEKSIFSTAKVLAVHNHKPTHCLTLNHHCSVHQFSKNVSQNSHYRSRVKPDAMITQTDQTIWKYKDKLTQEVLKTLKATGLNPDENLN